MHGHTIFAKKGPDRVKTQRSLMACMDSDGLGDLSSGNPDLGLGRGFGGPGKGFEGDFRLQWLDH